MKHTTLVQRMILLIVPLSIALAVFLGASWLLATVSRADAMPVQQRGAATADCPTCITPPPPPTATPTATPPGCPSACPTETPPAPPTPPTPPAPSGYDFGDAPDWQGQTTLPSGAHHQTVDALRLGTCVDTEVDGQPVLADSPALADDVAIGPVTAGPCVNGDDENGAAPIGSNFSSTGAGGFLVTVSGVSGSGACVYGWIDWNRNGFGDSGDATGGPLFFDLSGFQLVLFPPAPFGNPSQNMYYIRLRIAPATGPDCPASLSPTGLVVGGEVEDYDMIFAPPLAVSVATFTADATPDHIALTWETVSELDNLGFNLWRGTSEVGPDTQLNGVLIPSQAVGSSGGHAYTRLDRLDLTPGETYFYWLEAVDIHGGVTRHGPVSATFQAPTAVGLSDLRARSELSPTPAWWWAVMTVAAVLAVVTWRKRARP